MFPGGKGANQAVAAVRVGGSVDFICAVGDDVFGKKALEGYKNEGLDVSHAKVLESVSSGVALILVDESGENEIVVASGANAKLSPGHLQDALEALEDVAIFLTQLETPLETLAFLTEYCREHSKKLILNPAPAQQLEDAIFQDLFLITPNETEAQLLTGIAITDEHSLLEACQFFLDKGVHNCIVTMGSKGAYFYNGDTHFIVPAEKVEAVDTTAAGDVYNGVLAVCLAQNMGWEESMAFAGKAAALSVTKMGAQNSAPFKSEINQ